MSEEQSMALVKSKGFPAFLAPYATPDIKKDPRNIEDMGELEPADFGLSFIKLCHGSSREAKPGWDASKNAPPMPIGTIFLSRDHKIIPVDAKFVPLLRSTRFILWEGKPGDGRMVFMTHDRNDPRIKEIDGLAFTKDPNTGKTNPPLVTRYISYYVMCQYSTEPVVISFYRTSEPIGRKFGQDLWRATDSYTIPIRSLQFKFLQPRIEERGGNSWPQFVFEPDGFVAQDTFVKGNELYDAAKGLDVALKGTEFGALEDPGDEGEPRRAEGEVLTQDSPPQVNIQPDQNLQPTQDIPFAAPAPEPAPAPAQQPTQAAPPAQPAQESSAPETKPLW